MVGIVDDFRIVFAFFLSLLVGRGIFLSGEDEGVFVEPVDPASVAGEFGEGIGFSAVRTEQPDLPGGGVGLFRLGVGTRAGADEGDPFAVGRPLRGGHVVGTAGELDGAIVGEAGEEKVGDARVFFLVAFTLDPGDGARIGREREIVDGFLKNDVVGFPGGGFRCGFCVVSEERRSTEQCCREKKRGNTKISAGQSESPFGDDFWSRESIVQLEWNGNGVGWSAAEAGCRGSLDRADMGFSCAEPLQKR